MLFPQPHTFRFLTSVRSLFLLLVSGCLLLPIPNQTAAADEIADPRPVAELIRQWSTDHPEFQFLPRKFKVAVTGSETDRAVTKAHDIGLRMVRQNGQPGFEVIVGGGLGRTPMIGKVLRDFLPVPDLLPYLEAVVGT